jgi:DNA-binding CsgD family transcriptional regulator
MIYCSLIEACQELSDWGRATERTRVLTEWVDEQPELVASTGQAALHRGQIMRLRGAHTDAGIAMAECGDVLRIRGDYSGAEDAYRRATEFGYEPQPGLALLWLARGRTSAAVAAIRRLLDEPLGPAGRCRLLPGAVDVLLGAGAVDEAPALTDELAGLAMSFGIATTRASASFARGSVHLARGDGSAAIAELRAAQRTWSDLDAPHEVARCRFLAGKAMLGLGDTQSATAELESARRTFHDLRALPEEQATTALTRPATPGGLTPREIEVLRLVADGMSTPTIAASLTLSHKTVERHLANIFVKLGVSSRTAAARFAIDHDLV